MLILQQLQCVQNHRHAALGICHPWPIGALAVEPEGTLGGSARPEHRVVVDHQQKRTRAVAFERADDIVPRRRICRRGGDFSAQSLETFDQHRADGLQPGCLAGACVDIDQLPDSVEVGRLFGLGFFSN